MIISATFKGILTCLCVAAKRISSVEAGANRFRVRHVACLNGQRVSAESGLDVVVTVPPFMVSWGADMKNHADRGRLKLIRGEASPVPNHAEVEIGRLTDFEYVVANPPREIFLDGGQDRRVAPQCDFEDELGRLRTPLVEQGDDTSGDDAAPDPLGWPGL